MYKIFNFSKASIATVLIETKMGSKQFVTF